MNASTTTRLSRGSMLAVSRAGLDSRCLRARTNRTSWQAMSMLRSTNMHALAMNASVDTTAVHFAAAGTTETMGANDIATKPYVKRPKETLQ